MPSTSIEVLRRYSQAEEEQLIEAVQAALVEALEIPEGDRTVRLLVHEPHRFARPPSMSDRYTLVNVDLFSGRSLRAKKALYQAIVRNLEALAIPRDHVKVRLCEIPVENWGVRGGLPASEVDLGFKIDV